MPLPSLSKKITDLVPEILDLKFGCVLEGKTVGLQAICIGYVHGNCYATYQETGQPRLIRVEKDIFKILGRPITLADVLRAMSKKLQYRDDMQISSNGEFYKWDYNELEYLSMNIYWDLTQPLSGQSEETLMFLDSIL